MLKEVTKNTGCCLLTEGRGREGSLGENGSRRHETVNVGAKHGIWGRWNSQASYRRGRRSLSRS